ncbi:Putative Sin3 binding protein [Septoria linicola]|uniref:Sin3 binding protein n=1 Tax=Septoria linicola TaxID=215465 RepID=A0A9Q9AHH0_9PEZI|nr:putative Sin3 binding protein [Septoria linicola]USW47769.1 Putative Sin3 binding protein [Septoria linicola]
MAYAPTSAMASASQVPSASIPIMRDHADISGTAVFEKRANALLTPPSSISPELAAHSLQAGALSPPPINIEHDMDMQEENTMDTGSLPSGGTPLSRGALSSLDGAVAITPSMLAKHHLPAILLNQGPRPIRHVMGELTHTVPGFSRIPPAKARRIVVAALESRNGGGLDGSVTFSKTGWGRWDAHIKGSSRDSGVGSFNECHLSPPRSEHGSYAASHNDSAIHVPAIHMQARRREHFSGGSWTASSIREEDELDMDMDPIEEAADKMSLDGDSSESSETNSDTDNEDWTAVGVEALRKASLPTPNAPIQNYRKLSTPYTGKYATRTGSRGPLAVRPARPIHSSSVPAGNSMHALRSAVQSPAERDAVAALMSMGSM